MKKTLLFAVSLIMSICGAWAQEASNPASGIYEIKNVSGEGGAGRGYLVDYTSYAAGPSIGECTWTDHASKHPAERNNNTETSSYWYLYNEDGNTYIFSLSTLNNNATPKFLSVGAAKDVKATWSTEKVALEIAASTRTGNSVEDAKVIKAAGASAVLSFACGTQSTSGAISADTNLNDGGNPVQFIEVSESSLSEAQKTLMEAGIAICKAEVEYPTFDAEKKYILENAKNSRGKMAYNPAEESKVGLADVTLDNYGSKHVLSSTEGVSINWIIEATATKGVVYLKNADNNKYLCKSGVVAVWGESPVALTVSQREDNSYNLKAESLYLSLACGYTEAEGAVRFLTYEANAADFTITEATVTPDPTPDPADLTAARKAYNDAHAACLELYNQYKDLAEIHEGIHEAMAKVNDINFLTEADFNAATAEELNEKANQIKAALATAEAEIKAILPSIHFQPVSAEEYEAAKNVYISINPNLNPKEYFCVEDNNVNLAALQENESYEWKVIGNETDGYQIYNVAAGRSKILYAADNNSTPALVEVTTLPEGSNIKWDMTPSAQDSKGVYLSLHGDNSKYLNRNAGTRTLVFWEGKDAGSTIKIQEIGATPEAAEFASTIAEPKAFKLTNNGDTPVTIANNLTIFGSAGSNSAAEGKFIFIFTGKEDQYKIYETTSKKYLAIKADKKSNAVKDATTLVENEADAEEWVITASAKANGFWLIKSATVADAYLNYYQGDQANVSGQTIGFWKDGDGDKGCRWSMIETTITPDPITDPELEAAKAAYEQACQDLSDFMTEYEDNEDEEIEEILGELYESTFGAINLFPEEPTKDDYIEATQTINEALAEAKAAIEALGTTTGVDAIESANNNVIYNLQGHSMKTMQRGLNIVNGKKVVF